MPADPLDPGEVDLEPRLEGQFRADLVRYLDSLPVSELGSLLSQLPRGPAGRAPGRAEPAAARLRQAAPAGRHPGPDQGRRRSLREWGGRPSRRAQQSQAGPPDVVDRSRSVRALGEEAEADRVELERRAMAHDDPGCPPDIAGPDEPGTSEQRNSDRRSHDAG